MPSLITDLKHYGVGLTGSIYFKETEVIGCIDDIDGAIFRFSAEINPNGSLVIKYMNNTLVLDTEETFKEINPAILFSALVYAPEDVNMLYWLNRLPHYDENKIRYKRTNIDTLIYVDMELYKHLTLLEIKSSGEMPEFKNKKNENENENDNVHENVHDNENENETNKGSD